MMAGHMTPDARAVSIRAYEHAIRLGHRYLGGEHFLLALAAADQPAGAVLRDHGVTPERIEEEIVRLAGGGLFGGLDRDALASIGIDVGAVRARIEASFGPGALIQAGQAVHRGPRRARLNPRRVSGAERAGAFLPHGPGVDQSRRNALREAQARHGTQIGVDCLALGLLAVNEGLVPPILSALGVSAPALRAAIVNRCPLAR
jgi:Clp amino terminal domain, pathogenicity island component